MNYQTELNAMLAAAANASRNVLKYYNKNTFSVETKDDNSPVTTADLASNEIIVECLSRLFPDYAILSEETADNKNRMQNPYVFIIDPIDGTKDFIAHNNEFAINIALVHNNEVVAGVVAVPALGLTYFASKGDGAYLLDQTQPVDDLKPIHVTSKTSGLTVLTSRFHYTDSEKSLVEKHKDKIANVKTVGSAYKICCIAQGLAEITYRTNPGTKEWDTAAPQIIVEEAGGMFIDLKTMSRMKYNREDVRNLDGYIVVNRKENIIL